MVVNWWAAWCIPCRDEMPRIVAAVERYDGRVKFLGIDVEDDASDAVRFARKYEINFPSFADSDGAIRRDNRIVGLPVTQFFNSDGKLALVHAGEIQADELTEKIEEILRVSKGAA